MTKKKSQKKKLKEKQKNEKSKTKEKAKNTWVREIEIK